MKFSPFSVLRIVPPIALLFILLLIVGCNVDPEDKTFTNPPLQDDLAKVVVSFPIDNPRGVSLGDAKEYTNYYEVIFRSVGDTPQYASANSSGTAIELSILPDTYDILLFAGYKGSGPIHPVLLASAYEEKRTILIDQINTVSLVLDTVDVVLEAPDEVPVGTKFSPVVTVETKNPLIQFPKNYSLSKTYLGFRYSGDISGSVVLYAENISDTLWGFTPYNSQLEFTAPASTGSTVLQLDNSADPYCPFDQESLNKWSLAYTTSGTSFLNDWYSKTVNFVTASSQPKVTINVSWKE